MSEELKDQSLDETSVTPSLDTEVESLDENNRGGGFGHSGR